MINFTADAERVDISVKLEIIDIISDILSRYGSLFSPYLRGVCSYDIHLNELEYCMLERRNQEKNDSAAFWLRLHNFLGILK